MYSRVNIPTFKLMIKQCAACTKILLGNYAILDRFIVNSVERKSNK